MTGANDEAYYRQREEEELARAEAATSPEIGAVRADMAVRYGRLATSDMPRRAALKT